MSVVSLVVLLAFVTGLAVLLVLALVVGGYQQSSRVARQWHPRVFEVGVAHAHQRRSALQVKLPEVPR